MLDVVEQLINKIQERDATIATLREALKSCPCPGGGTEPTVENCMAHDACGCVFGDAISSRRQTYFPPATGIATPKHTGGL